MAKVQCGPTGTLKGHFKALNPTRVTEHNLEYVELLVKVLIF